MAKPCPSAGVAAAILNTVRDRLPRPRELHPRPCPPWGEWSQMGLSGRRGASDKQAMDPEALLLFTIEVARLDPRPFDETLDWLATNGTLLSLTRLRHLEARHPGTPTWSMPH